MTKYDAVVIGSGPNGLAAAITIAQAGRAVLVLEARDTVGGGTRSGETTLPGFVSDVCSAVHPLGASSPFFASLPLAQHGLEWVHPEIPLAHPFDDGTAAAMLRSPVDTAERLRGDAKSYLSTYSALIRDWGSIAPSILQPITRVPRHPIAMARFGLKARRSALGFATSKFEGRDGRALFVGIAAHAIAPMGQPLSASFGLVLGTAGHAVGWPVARGGSGAIASALAAHLLELGGTIETGTRVRKMSELPPAKAYLFDTTPAQLLAIAGEAMPSGGRRAFRRFRYGPGSFKVDFALDGPIPWLADECRGAGTVHLGGPYEAIARSEDAVLHGKTTSDPYMIVAQQSVFDATRAPAGKHVAWAYCHVPAAWTGDMTEAIERQIERFAPGFRDLILAKHATGPAALAEYNENYIGGDIAGGAAGGLQLIFRPRIALDPYRTPLDGAYLCSSSTPPGPGVHGMAGYWAARSALKRELR
ncbi:MAG: phytoene desaturase family protein [Tepidiformaceae bacterium]